MNPKKRDSGKKGKHDNLTIQINRAGTDINDIDVPQEFNSSLRDILDEPYLLDRGASSGDTFGVGKNHYKTEAEAQTAKLGLVTASNQISHENISNVNTKALELGDVSGMSSPQNVYVSTTTENDNENGNDNSTPKSPMKAFNSARKKFVNTLSSATKHDRRASSQQFPIDSVCHPSMEVSMREKVLRLNTLTNVTQNVSRNTSTNHLDDGFTYVATDGDIGTEDGMEMGKITQRNSQALSPADISKIEEFHFTGDVFDLSNGLRLDIICSFFVCGLFLFCSVSFMCFNNT